MPTLVTQKYVLSLIRFFDDIFCCYNRFNDCLYDRSFLGNDLEMILWRNSCNFYFKVLILLVKDLCVNFTNFTDTSGFPTRLYFG